MQFQSTRGRAPKLGFADAFAAGLAPDGGLYVPDHLPELGGRLEEWLGRPYAEIATGFLGLFDTDHSPDELAELATRSYATFEDPANAAPLRRLDDNLHVLELFHGPTLAFKDFGLQLVGNLFEDQIRRTGTPINVLGATSGDTGAAAIHGLAGRQGVRVFILYPEGRISPLQERQMTCTGETNIFPIPIEGSFDDAQRIVKDLFGDLDFKRRARLSAVNSINLARVLAQSVYYVSALLQLRAAGIDEPPDFVVPTGNFGNVFAGWMARRMGLPAARFVIATNRNDILHRLFRTGAYEPGDVIPSLAPSMDIQVASNFERFLFYQLGGDSRRVAEMMDEVRREGRLVIPGFDPDVFRATRSGDEEIMAAIADAHRRFGYLVDPHTACGFAGLDPSRLTVVLSTAHPAKFPETIVRAIGIEPTHPTLEVLKAREPVRHPLPAEAGAVREFIDANAA